MNQKGQGLIEALIALGAAVIIIAAMTIAVITALNNADFSSYQNLATNYAQQGIEIIQQKSQLSWTDTSKYQGIYCLSQGVTNVVPIPAGEEDCPVNVDNKFVRELDFIKITPQLDCANSTTPCCFQGPQNINCALTPELCSSQVNVTVKWTDGKCSSSSDFCHQVVLNSCITDIYRNITPTP
jgi:Tfp pilus assembly protein PilV